MLHASFRPRLAASVISPLRFANPAGSARGISPRAAHRSGREPLGSSGSCHPEKAAAFHQDKEFLRFPVDSTLTWVTCSLCSTGITPSHRSYEAVRPWSVHRYFRPRGVSACAFSLSITRPGSQVPHESPDKSHAAYTPDPRMASKVGNLPCCSRDKVKIPVLGVIIPVFDASSADRLHSSLLSPHDVISVTPFNHNVHHRGLWTEAAYGCLKPPPTRRLRRTYLHLSYSMTISRLLDTITSIKVG